MTRLTGILPTFLAGGLGFSGALLGLLFCLACGQENDPPVLGVSPWAVSPSVLDTILLHGSEAVLTELDDTVASLESPDLGPGPWLPVREGLISVIHAPLSFQIIKPTGSISTRRIRDWPEDSLNATIAVLCTGSNGTGLIVYAKNRAELVLVRGRTVVARWPWQPPGDRRTALPDHCAGMAGSWTALFVSAPFAQGGSGAFTEGNVYTVGDSESYLSELLTKFPIAPTSLTDSLSHQSLQKPFYEWPILTSTPGAAFLLTADLENPSNLKLESIDSTGARSLHILKLDRSPITSGLQEEVLGRLTDSVDISLLRAGFRDGMYRRRIKRLIAPGPDLVLLLRGDLGPSRFEQAGDSYLDAIYFKDKSVRRIRIPHDVTVLGASTGYLYLCHQARISAPMQRGGSCGRVSIVRLPE